MQGGDSHRFGNHPVLHADVRTGTGRGSISSFIETKWVDSSKSFLQITEARLHTSAVYGVHFVLNNLEYWKWNICLPEVCLKILCESSQISSEFKIERDGKSKSQSFLGLAFSFLLTHKVGPSRSSHLTSLKCSYAFCFLFF